MSEGDFSAGHSNHSHSHVTDIMMQQFSDHKKSKKPPEVYEGVPLCRKYAIVIRNHGRHDIETIRKILRDVKKYDNDARLRPIWISGFGGEEEVARIDSYNSEGDKKADGAEKEAAENNKKEEAAVPTPPPPPAASSPAGHPLKITSLSKLKEVDPRNKMLMRHVKLQCRNISLYIADDTDPAKERLFRCGVYMFDGFQTAQAAPGAEKQLNKEIQDIAYEWKLSKDDIQQLKEVRGGLHMRFYLSPEPPLHPDRYNKDGLDTRRVNVGTATTLSKIRGTKEGGSDVVLVV